MEDNIAPHKGNNQKKSKTNIYNNGEGTNLNIVKTNKTKSSALKVSTDAVSIKISLVILSLFLILGAVYIRYSAPEASLNIFVTPNVAIATAHILFSDYSPAGEVKLLK